ncbi:MAG: hypothetical protein GXY61_03210 [Lentisphaerae bacterium]|jgi:F0F1-type ATP synthase membrane subunit c/vacuolar-type H+-ATPase subunit K|nr:hypothetical protein [Lentisphaerota bacterium]
MKMTRQKNTFLLLGAALVIGLVAMGASNEVQNAAAEKVEVSTNESTPTDLLVLEELQKTNRILLKMAETYVEQQKATTEFYEKQEKITTQMLTGLKKLDETQTASLKSVTEISEMIEKLAKTIDNQGKGKDLSIDELLEDIKSLLRNVNSSINALPR